MKIDKPLAKLTKRYRESIQINNIRSEKRDILRDTKESQRVIRPYFKKVLHKIENLKEMNFGLWECKTFDELKELEDFEQWVNDKEGIFAFPGGGDSTSSFYARVAEGLEELIAYHNSRKGSNESAISVVVCHGGVIAACMCNLFNKPKETFWEWIPKPGRGYTVYFEDDKPVRYDVI